ncbi:MAG: hypothetical protein RR934_03185 [Gordonibacter sp.]|uniref:hypothetical protein n=1 Tax=Gordonibacter sp. TaxID=1968902 RepID=UPI00322088ED
MNRSKVVALGAVLVLGLGLLAGCGGPSNTSQPASNEPQGSNSSPAPAASSNLTQNFTLVNNTGVEVYGVFVSPVSTDNWEEDVMGRETLPSGSSVDITFHGDSSEQYWDLMVTDAEDVQLIFEKLDLFSISEVTISIDASGNPVASVS